MTFEKYCDDLIDTLVNEVYNEKGIELDQDQKDQIYLALEEHEECFNKLYDKYNDRLEEIMTVETYIDDSVGIDCSCCNTTIIDTIDLLGE